MSDPATPLRCPYVGLQPYTEADIDYFFGRERDQRIIAANLGAARLTILYGASGVGKSSVLLAGVVPYLRARSRTAAAVVRDWQGPGFLEALKYRCQEAVERVLQRPLSIDPGLPLDEFLGAAAEAMQGSLLIIFDQFEEYFLYHPELETGQTFDAELARAINRDEGDVAFLIALREDGLAKLDRFGGRIPNLLGNTLRLQHLTSADAATAIRKPLEVFNERHAPSGPVAIEDALVDAIISQVRSGQVTLSRSGGVGQADNSDETARIETPFLQLVMTRLWAEEINAGSRTLRLATLERLGGAEKIVRMHLDEVMDGLDAARQEVCAKFFDRLVTPSGTKIACNLRDLIDWAAPRPGEVAPILEILCANRVLRGVTTPGADRPSDTSYEIYHDVIAPAILDWRRGYLQAQERAETDRRAAEQAQAEAKATYASRLRNLYAVAGGLAVIAIVFLGLWVRQLQLQRAELSRQAHARELAASAKNIVESNPELGILLAVEAVRATSVDGSMTDEAFNGLQQIVHAPHEEKRLLGLNGRPRTMFFSPDGTRLVATTLQPVRDPLSGLPVSAWRPTTMIWDIASGSRAPMMVDEKVVNAFAVSPDGQRVATAGSDGAARILDAASGKEIFRVVHNSVVIAADFSSDGRRLATASIDGTTKASDAGSGKELFTLVGQDSKITALAYSPDAKWLAVASEDQTLTVLDSDTGAIAFKKSMPAQSVAALTFDADGKRLATVSLAEKQNVTIWEVPSGSSGPPLGGWYSAVAFSSDGNFLAGIGQDMLVHLWDIGTAEGIEPLGVLSRRARLVEQVIFSPDSTRIATASFDGTARIWDVGTERELVSLKCARVSLDGANFPVIAFSPQGALVAAACHDGTVSVWDVGFYSSTPVWRMTLSANGRLLATSSSSAGGTVKIWDADDGRSLGTLGTKLGDRIWLAFSPDQSQLLTANREGEATVWDLKTFRPIVGPFSTGLALTTAQELAWSARKRLVMAGENGVAGVWDPADGQKVRTFGGRESLPMAALSLSGDGRHLAIVTPNRNRLEIWDEGMDHPSWSYDAHKDPPLKDVVLSPDGRYVASVSETGLKQLWDVRSNERLRLPGDYLAQDDVFADNGMAFSSDGTHLAIAFTKTVAVWDIVKKTNPRLLPVGGVRTLAFSHDGKRLATGSFDGTLQVWRLAAEDLIMGAERLIPRRLHKDECEVYHVEPCPTK